MFFRIQSANIYMGKPTRIKTYRSKARRDISDDPYMEHCKNPTRVTIIVDLAQKSRWIFSFRHSSPYATVCILGLANPLSFLYKHLYIYINRYTQRLTYAVSEMVFELVCVYGNICINVCFVYAQTIHTSVL